ncbi:hypothetical protein GCM10009554_79880 [Kribbella koreensis]|uniref:Uncharacterized protein n=1 Tax=Kribbella koreensis TaxID=57909 RepID=A0ABP4C7Q4_9ACTN
MAEQPRRRPDSAVPDIGDGLWERIQAAVLAEAGADKSLWNGELGYTDPAESVRGEAYGYGKLNLSEESVVRPLREMYEQRGQRVTEEQLIARRSAFQVVAHEFGHLAVPEEYQLADRAADIKRGDLTPIEEGTNEAWSQARTDALIDRALPRDLALQLRSVDSLRTYPGWDSAARAFADDVGAEIGVEGDEVLSVMNREARSGKGRAAADLLYEHSELPRLVPADQQTAVRAELQSKIDEGFAALKPLNDDKTVNRRAYGRQRGQELAESLVGTVQAAEKHYLSLESGRQAQAAQQTQDLSALPPPDPADRRPGPGSGSYAQQAADDDARVAAAMAKPVDPRVAFAQWMAAGQAPAADAVRQPRGDGRAEDPPLGEQAARVEKGERPGGRAAAGRSTESPER